MGTLSVTAHSQGNWGTESEHSRIHPALPYLGLAQEFLRAAKVLTANDPSCAAAIGLLVAQGLENALKSSLTRGGARTDLKTHDLASLWESARTSGLELSEDKPTWFHPLWMNHKKPFADRYSENKPIVVNPSPSAAVQGLQDVVESVRAQLSAHGIQATARNDA